MSLPEHRVREIMRLGERALMRTAPPTVVTLFNILLRRTDPASIEAQIMVFEVHLPPHVRPPRDLVQMFSDRWYGYEQHNPVYFHVPCFDTRATQDDFLRSNAYAYRETFASNEAPDWSAALYDFLMKVKPTDGVQLDHSFDEVWEGDVLYGPSQRISSNTTTKLRFRVPTHRGASFAVDVSNAKQYRAQTVAGVVPSVVTMEFRAVLEDEYDAERQAYMEYRADRYSSSYDIGAIQYHNWHERQRALMQGVFTDTPVDRRPTTDRGEVERRPALRGGLTDEERRAVIERYKNPDYGRQAFADWGSHELRGMGPERILQKIREKPALEEYT